MLRRRNVGWQRNGNYGHVYAGPGCHGMSLGIGNLRGCTSAFMFDA